MPDFDHYPTAPLQNLAALSALLQRIRSFFHQREFLEVMTPMLSEDTVVDRFLEPIPVSVERMSHRFRTYYLQTSPEFAMKRLLVAGAQAIFQVTHAFRGGDIGRFHNIEFTMLEWYRLGDDYDSGMRLLAEFAERICSRGTVEFRSFGDVFFRYTGLNPHTDSPVAMRDFADDNRIPYPESFACLSSRKDLSQQGYTENNRREPWVDLLFAEFVQPNLGVDRPVIVADFPVWQSQLAQTRRVDCGGESCEVAERFELYVDGIELANGYHELTDPDDLLRRNRRTNAVRVADGREPLPEESRLIRAMRDGLPPCCGTSLGIERLLMVLLTLSSIEEVIAFPFDRA